jgi:single-strand selective monofunctional uracil DNA glycosylase
LHLIRVVELLKPEFLAGVGKFAEQRFKNLEKAGVFEGWKKPPVIFSILHPSPASPAANRGWAQAVEADLKGRGVWA